MSNHLQNFFVAQTQSVLTDFVAAYLRIPEGKRDWKPEGKSRSAHDQVAELALLNGYTAELIRDQKWPALDMNRYPEEHSAMAAKDWETLHALLKENTRKVTEAIAATPDDALDKQIEMPWGTMALAESVAYPYWNLTYHLGQINYIASMLGCLP